MADGRFYAGYKVVFEGSISNFRIITNPNTTYDIDAVAGTFLGLDPDFGSDFGAGMLVDDSEQSSVNEAAPSADIEQKSSAVEAELSVLEGPTCTFTGEPLDSLPKDQLVLAKDGRVYDKDKLN